jgi:hypothetical protein
MMTTVLEPQQRSLKTTDGARFGFDLSGQRVRSETALAELTHDLSTAVGDAYWAYMLQGELEDAFDSALMRAAMDETPVLSGPLPVWAI